MADDDPLIEARDILMQALPTAAKRLVEMAVDADDRVAISAIAALMDRAGLGKVSAEPISTEARRAPIELLVERLERIEERLADGPQPG